MELIVDNSDLSIIDTARAQLLAGSDPVAVAGALLKAGVAMGVAGDEPMPDVAIEIMAPVIGRDQARAVVTAAMDILEPSPHPPPAA